MIANLCKSPRYHHTIVRRLVTNVKAEPVNQHALDWDNAQPYSQIPGPSFFQIVKWFSPGGRFDGLVFSDALGHLRREFGDIVKLKGVLGKEDTVFLFKPEDFATMFRTEGGWPVRRGMNAFVYYRSNVRADVFKGVGGLVSENGKGWHDFRTVVNPVMMQPKATKVYVPRVDEIAKEFIEIIRTLRDSNLETPASFGDYVNRWSLESISCIALDTRLKVMDDATKDVKAKGIVQAVRSFFELSHQVELQPISWKFYKNETFKKLMVASDELTYGIMSYVEKAIERLEQNPTTDEVNQGVLEKLMKINKHIAKVMAFDMLMAGVDTTSSASIGILYCLAKNPEKQAKLREEIVRVLPEKTSPLTAENMKNLPYLRAVIKEGLRVCPATPGTTRAAGQDLVIQGYQVPKDINLFNATGLMSKDDEHFPRSSEFLPERWLRDIQDTACPMARDANPFVYLPFGFGARSCVGRRFAELEIEVLIARLVREFSIEWHHAPLKFKSQLLDVPVDDIKFRLQEVSQ